MTTALVGQPAKQETERNMCDDGNGRTELGQQQKKAKRDMYVSLYCPRLLAVVVAIIFVGAAASVCLSGPSVSQWQLYKKYKFAK